MKEESSGKLEIGCGLAWWLGHLIQNPEVPDSNPAPCHQMDWWSRIQLLHVLEINKFSVLYSFSVIERFSTACRNTKTKPITYQLDYSAILNYSKIKTKTK